MRFSTALLFLVCTTLVSTSTAHADSYCSETVTQIIVKSDAVYFTTSKSCPNWCELNPSWDATAVDRALVGDD